MVAYNQLNKGLRREIKEYLAEKAEKKAMSTLLRLRTLTSAYLSLSPWRVVNALPHLEAFHLVYVFILMILIQYVGIRVWMSNLEKSEICSRGEKKR